MAMREVDRQRLLRLRKALKSALKRDVQRAAQLQRALFPTEALLPADFAGLKAKAETLGSWVESLLFGNAFIS